jgi:hypothetical protein
VLAAGVLLRRARTLLADDPRRSGFRRCGRPPPGLDSEARGAANLGRSQRMAVSLWIEYPGRGAVLSERSP